LNLKPENRTEPNNPNCWSIRVSRFGFGTDRFIIRSSGLVSVLVVYNPNRLHNLKFNIVAYFDSNYDITTLLFKLLFEFFHKLVSYLL
jgi:hypothetical protein